MAPACVTDLSWGIQGKDCITTVREFVDNLIMRPMTMPRYGRLYVHLTSAPYVCNVMSRAVASVDW
eukprot:7365-Eustigmatos_ZCMA.PRE.1